MKHYPLRLTLSAIATLLVAGIVAAGPSERGLVQAAFAQYAENSRESGPDFTDDAQEENRITAYRTSYNNLQTAADIGRNPPSRSNDDTVYISDRHGGENVALHSRNGVSSPFRSNYNVDGPGYSMTE